VSSNYVYDLETFLHCFLFIGKMEGSNEVDVFEISNRKNEKENLRAHLSYLQNSGVVMIGYNNLGFDYPIIHQLLLNPFTFDQQRAYLLGQDIIKNSNFGSAHRIKKSDRIIPQIDLMKVHYFDNITRRVSLKALQFAMRSESVEDLPFAPDSDLTSEMIDQLISYGIHDVKETEAFLGKSKNAIAMRQEILDQGILFGDVLNYSEVKIGVEYLVNKIGRAKCYHNKQPKQTIRSSVAFKDIILPKIHFRTEEFEAVHEWFTRQIVYPKSKDAPKPSLESQLAGLQFHFGLGGVHASVENRKFETSETHIIKDIDVSGMYVAVAIANGFAPEHLGGDFVRAYRQLQSDRSQYPKGSIMNLILKLAGNGVYGNSNNEFSCFYDPQYTFTVTVNGQLQLLQLAEVLSTIPRIEIIQANTDGITVYMPREHAAFFDVWCRDWEKQTGLKLEEVDYKTMWISDVNNYLAITMDGKIKRKGKYWYPESEKDYEGTGSGSVWHKDFSNMAVQKCIEPVLVHGFKPRDVVRCLSNPFDFMLRYKTPAGARVYLGDKEMPKTVRYYVSKAGASMKKVSMPKGEIGDFKRKNGLQDSYYNKIKSEIPPGTWDERIHNKKKSKYEQVTTSIESGWLVKECNRADKFNWKDVDYDYYTAEIEKLVIQ
jgi:flagellar biosynthesis regulator FlaF